ncbi:sialidase family protein [Vibrio salinus]|uniref:sialidase family protein n=1 Tax=Vibrio salinus TaxID=2899784 RepID=UPI001E4FC6A5|nr:sialidase family protein [Vibrio salinus]MCE0495637.1 exo-alpha-sialidase [Vibrio salinus]
MNNLIHKEAQYTLFSTGEVFFKQCHASSIVVLPNQDKLITFFAGEKEGALDTAIWLVKETDGVWSEPYKAVDDEFSALWNPVLYTQDNVVWLFYKSGENVQTWITKVIISEDYGKSWSSPVDLVAGEKLPRGPVKNKLILLSNGNWIAPNSIEAGLLWDAFADYSTDNGQTWHQVPVPLQHITPQRELQKDTWQGLETGALWETEEETVFSWDGVIQPTLWESKPGNVHMLMRSTRGAIYRSDSDDYGRSWCEAYATSLPNNNSGLDLASDSKRLFLVYNPVASNWGARTPLSISISFDNGVSWSSPTHLETEKGEFSYPAIVYREGVIHITYTSNRETIIYQRWKISHK